MAAVHVYTVSQLTHIPHLLVMTRSEAYQVNASLIPTVGEAAWQVPQVQTAYRCKVMVIAISYSSEYGIRAHDTEKVDFLVVDATVFCRFYY